MSDARVQLTELGRHIVARGLSHGTTGNVSIRVDDRVYVSATGAALGDLDPGSIAVVDLREGVVSDVSPSKEYPVHAAFYARRPEARAIVHVHATYGVALSCLPAWSADSAIPPITPYFVMKVGRTPLLSYAAPGSGQLVDSLARHGGTFSAALLQNHGAIVAAATPLAALEMATELEETARVTLLLAGRPARVLSDIELARLVEDLGAVW